MATRKSKAFPAKKAAPPKVSQKKKPEKRDSLIVGIGASAGGLETLKAFFQNMSADSGIAYPILVRP
jgi:chemotaxis response regulator CheB